MRDRTSSIYLNVEFKVKASVSYFLAQAFEKIWLHMNIKIIKQIKGQNLCPRKFRLIVKRHGRQKLHRCCQSKIQESFNSRNLQ